MWISRLRARSRVDLQVEKTFLNMVSNVLPCWWNRCYITSKEGEKFQKESCLSWILHSWNLRSGLNCGEFKISADGSRFSACEYDSQRRPRSSLKRRMFPSVRVTLWATRRPPQVVVVPGKWVLVPCFEFWWLKLGPGGSVWHRLVRQLSDALLSPCSSASLFPNFFFLQTTKAFLKRNKKILKSLPFSGRNAGWFYCVGT